MLEIEEYLNNNRSFDKNIYAKNETFGITNNDFYKRLIDINLWANNINIDGTCDTRQEQQKFREQIILRDKKCIVTEFPDFECEACHIIPVADNGSYDVNNGLLINANHHKSFDKNLWAINPDTLKIDVLTNDEKVVGSIINYANNEVNISPNNIMKYFLEQRWTKYIEHKKQYMFNTEEE